MPSSQNLTCNDGILFLALGYCIVVLIIKWSEYEDCKYPLNLFLLVNYATILLFRSLSFLQYCLRNSRRAVIAIAAIKVFGLYGFFVVWTITGTVWFALGHQCLPQENQYPTYIIWFVLCYLGIVGYMVFVCLVYHLNLVGPVFLSPGGINPNDLPENPLWHYEPINQGIEDSLISRIPSRPVTYDESCQRLQCAICLDSLEEGQIMKELNPCSHKFHREHIDEWLSRKSSCPICRSEVQVPQDV